MLPAIVPEDAQSLFQVERIRRIEYYSIQKENPKRWVYYFRMIHEPIFVEFSHNELRATKRYLHQLSKNSREAQNLYLRCAMKCTALERIEKSYVEVKKELQFLREMGDGTSDMYVNVTGGQQRKLEEWQSRLEKLELEYREIVEYRKRVVSSVTSQWVHNLPNRIRP